MILHRQVLRFCKVLRYSISQIGVYRNINRIVAFCLTILIGYRPLLNGQQPSLSPFTTPGELQLEAVTEANEDVETEDDSFLQAMRHFLRNPVNVNEADATALKELLVLSPQQIEHILSYRRLLGNFLHL